MNKQVEPKDAKPVEAGEAGIFAAIAHAIGEVKQLGKSDRNKFDGYDFVSIDKFLTLVNPICAKTGLFPSINQDAVELYENTNSKGGKATWARFYYSISLHHKTGQTFGPCKSMVAVPMNGAQASGSAQSYALKQFFRGIFLIPTGDKDDADLNATEQHHEVKNHAPQNEAVEKAKEYLSEADSFDELKRRWEGIPTDTQRAPAVIKAKDDRKAALGKPATEQKPIIDDEIPY